MENIILHWLQAHIAMVATWVIGLPLAVAAIKKYGPKIRKVIKIIRESADVIDTLLDALQDDNISDEDIQKIIKEVNDFKEAIK